MVAQQYDDSILQFNKAIDLEPNAMWIHALLAWTYGLRGNSGQAIVEYEKMGRPAYAVSAENQLIASGLGWIYARAGRRKDAERVIEQLNALSSVTVVDPYWVAVIYSGLGDKSRALELLEESYRQRSGNLAFLETRPFLGRPAIRSALRRPLAQDWSSTLSALITSKQANGIETPLAKLVSQST